MQAAAPLPCPCSHGGGPLRLLCLLCTASSASSALPPLPPLAQVQLSGCLSLARRQVEEARELYEHAATADRELDKGFKREFADCEVFVDQLYKLFRKRPR